MLKSSRTAPIGSGELGIISPFYEGVVPGLDVFGLLVPRAEQLVFQSRDVGDPLLLESGQAGVKSFLGENSTF